MKESQKILTKKVTCGLVIIGILCAFLASILFDRVVGWYLKKSHYFFVFNPSITVIFHTTEYNAQAHINSIGLRNPEITVPKPKNVYRILAVGDSFTFGWGVNSQDTWEQQLQNMFVQNGKKVEVINAGFPGLELDSYKNACNAYADWVQADAVIIGFDSTDDINQRIEIYNNLESRMPFWQRLYPRMFSLSHKYISPVIDPSFVPKKGETFSLTHTWQQEARSYETQAPNILVTMDPSLRQDYWDGKINPAQFYYAAVDPQYYTHILNPSYFQYGINLVAAKLAEFKHTCSGKRPVFFVNLPSSELISTNYFPYKEQEGFKLDPNLVTFDMDSALSQIAKTNGFYYLSAIPSMRADGCPDCFYKYDGHPSPIGTKRIAQVIYEGLKDIIK